LPVFGGGVNPSQNELIGGVFVGKKGGNERHRRKTLMRLNRQKDLTNARVGPQAQLNAERFPWSGREKKKKKKQRSHGTGKV